MAHQDRIVFDENFKTFRLYPGNSLYAFSISPELSLEHLYFGKRLHGGFDLRYLSQSSRSTHFSTAEMNKRSDLSMFHADTIEELQETWSRATAEAKAGASNADEMYQKRVQNISWRLMSLRLIEMENDRKVSRTAPCTPARERIGRQRSSSETDNYSPHDSQERPAMARKFSSPTGSLDMVGPEPRGSEEGKPLLHLL